MVGSLVHTCCPHAEAPQMLYCQSHHTKEDIRGRGIKLPGASPVAGSRENPDPCHITVSRAHTPNAPTCTWWLSLWGMWASLGFPHCGVEFQSPAGVIWRDKLVYGVAAPHRAHNWHLFRICDIIHSVMGHHFLHLSGTSAFRCAFHHLLIFMGFFSPTFMFRDTCGVCAVLLHR